MYQELARGENIWKSIVLVHALNDNSKKVFGTGFVVGHPNDKSTMILTCGHVVESIGKTKVAVNDKAVKVIADKPGCKPDLAVLLLEEKIECPVVVIRRNPLKVEDIKIHGYYRRSSSSEHRLATLTATVSREEATYIPHKHIPAWDVKVLDGPIPPGYSGSPAMLAGSNEVIGVTTMRVEGNRASVISIAGVDELSWSSEGLAKYFCPFVKNNSSKDMEGVFQQYKILKEKVIGFYEKYRSVIKTPVRANILEGKIEEVKEDRFTLALAGEVKAGKSTFINALLGEMLLPTGFLQSTSAIIEIVHSRQKFLDISYGNGLKKRAIERSFGRKGVVIKDSDKDTVLDESRQYLTIADFLRVTASIQEKYRELPFQQLNTLLLEHRGKDIESARIDQVCNEYNEYNLESHTFRAAVCDYIEEFRDLSKIPVEIKLGYPLKPELEQLRIIDTPGVNAIGGVESITYNYLTSADAIIFLHSADSPIENASFKKFVEDETADRVKGNLFLALTKSGMVTEAVRERRLAEAKKLFSKHLSPERMVYVDSLLRIVSDQTKKFQSFDDLLSSYSEKAKEYKKKRQADPQNEMIEREYDFYSSVHRLLRNLQDEEDNIDVDFRGIILGKSGFDNILSTLGKFSSTAPISRAAELLRIISLDYEVEKNRLLKRIQLIRARMKSSKDFQEQADADEADIQKDKATFVSISEEVRKKYMNSDAAWVKELKQIVKDYKKKARKRLEKGKKIKKVSRDLSEDFEYLAKKVVSNVFQELSGKMRENDIDFDVTKYSCSTPKVAGMGQTVKEAKTASYKTKQVTNIVDVPSMRTFKKPGIFGTDLFSETSEHQVFTPEEVLETVSYFDSDEFIEGVMSEVKEEFNDARDSTESRIDSMISKICKDFEEQAQIVVQQRMNDLNELRQRQFDIEECKKDISVREGTIAVINEQLYAINPILIAYRKHIE